MYTDPVTITDMFVVALTLACIIILAAEVIHPFIDDACDRLLGVSRTSKVNDEDMYPEVDHTIIEAFLKEPSDAQRETIQVHIDRRTRRENAEEAMLLERFRL